MAPGARPRYAVSMSGRAKADSVTGRELGAITRGRHAGALERWAAKLHRPHGRLAVAPVRADVGAVTVSGARGSIADDILVIESAYPGGTEGIVQWIPHVPPPMVHDLDDDGRRMAVWIANGCQWAG